MNAMVTYRCQQYIRDDGSRMEDPPITDGVTLNIAEDGSVDLFYASGGSVHFRAFTIRISAHGILIKGVESQGTRMHYREFWLCYATLLISR